VAESKTRQGDADVGTFLDAIPDQERRNDAKALLKLMRAATGEVPKMWGPSIIGFGSYHYVYDSGREGDAPVVGFSPRKSALVLYLHLGDGEVAKALPQLGKHTTGKGCLYVKRMADVDPKVLERIIRGAFANTRKRHASA
jgi:hypothetical protein